MFFKKHKSVRVDKMSFPKHIAIILDGNGRWAKKRGLPRSAGHSMGAKNLENVVRYLKDTSVRYLTVYAFSTENWKRPKDEVDDLMALLEKYLRNYDELLGGEDVRLKIIGRKEGLSDTLIDLINEVEEKSKNRKQLTVSIALNYGGRQEICDAAKKIAEDVKSGKIDVSDIDENLFNDYVYTKNIPDPDLIIRPSGEERLSNFLLWQCAYSEFWFSNVCWPDFTPDKLEGAEDFETALHDLIRDTIRAHKRIIFNGNGYDATWIKEATEVRGLCNYPTTPDCMPHLLDKKNVDMLTSHKIYSVSEIQARCDIMLENYCKAVIIEANTMVDMARKQILPAVEGYAAELAASVAAKKAVAPNLACAYETGLVTKLSGLTDQIAEKTDELESAVLELKNAESVKEESFAIRDTILGKMAALRAVADEAETQTSSDYWPFPTYGELLFGVK